MGRKQEVLNALNELGIDYNELESGEILFNHMDEHFWFHPDDAKPEYITVNKLNGIDSESQQMPNLSDLINEINKSSPGIKALMIGHDVILNCDLYSGRHRLCPEDLKAALSRLELTGKVFKQMLDKSNK